MNILFVCKHNRFRSKVAEALLKDLGGSNVDVKSAGVQLDMMRPYICENVKKTLKEKGINNLNELPRLINDFDLKWADKIIVVANNVAVEIFPKDRTEVWFTEDADESELEKIKQIIDEIELKVKKLVKRLH